MPVAYPDEHLEALIERLTRSNIAHLPVVSRDDRRLAGYLSWRDLMRARQKVKEAETQRVVFYRVR